MIETQELLGLADALRWRGVGPQIEVWVNVFDRRLRDSFDRLVDEQHASDLAEGFAALPSDKQRWLLRAPRVSRRLWPTRDRRPTLEPRLLAEAILAALVECRLIQKAPKRLWTAGGARIDAGAPRSNAPDRWPLLGNVDIDLDSDYPIPRMDRGGNELGSLSPADAQLAMHGLVDSANFILAGNDAAARLVRAVLRVISLRAEHSEPRTFGSGTFSNNVGFALFTNPHIDSVDVGVLANAIVHESIHCLLYLYESLTVPILSEDEARLPRIESPWSGKWLRAHSYVHACFVWYGLYWFWTAVSESSALDAQRVEQLAIKAQRGFIAKKATDRLACLRRTIAPAVWDALMLLESQMSSEVQ